MFLFGINFIDDSHVEAFASSCSDLEYLGLNFCSKFTGSSLQILLQKCKRLTSLMMQQTGKFDLCTKKLQTREKELLFLLSEETLKN